MSAERPLWGAQTDSSRYSELDVNKLVTDDLLPVDAEDAFTMLYNNPPHHLRGYLMTAAEKGLFTEEAAYLWPWLFPEVVITTPIVCSEHQEVSYV
jgi:hypothetical protein